MEEKLTGSQATVEAIGNKPTTCGEAAQSMDGSCRDLPPISSYTCVNFTRVALSNELALSSWCIWLPGDTAVLQETKCTKSNFEGCMDRQNTYTLN